MRHLTELHKNNISQTLKGRMPKFLPDNIGVVRTLENKQRISQTLKDKGILPPRPPRESLRRGENHPQWKGGVSTENERLRKSPEFKAWRVAVFVRDNYTCVKCGARGGNGHKVILHPDHIKPFALYPDLRFVVSNGRTLCVDCHKETSTYGNCWGNEVESDIKL